MTEKPNDRPSRPLNAATSSNPSTQLYRSYLLRLWSRLEEGEGRIWRASLESPITMEKSQFSDLESLFEFLRMVTEPEPATGQATDPAGRIETERQSNVEMEQENKSEINPK